MADKRPKRRSRIIEELKPGGSIVVQDERGVRPLKRPRDLNQWAKNMTDLATGEQSGADQIGPQKDPAAVRRGRLGGLKGGKARAKSMTAAERKAAAIKAIKTRWLRRSP